MMYRLRVYTLKDSASLAVYRDVHYPRLFGSFAEFGISIQGIWTSPGDDAPRLYVLTFFPADADPVQIERDYMQSPGFKADMEGFDRSNIVRVETTLLAPRPSGGSAHDLRTQATRSPAFPWPQPPQIPGMQSRPAELPTFRRRIPRLARTPALTRWRPLARLWRSLGK